MKQNIKKIGFGGGILMTLLMVMGLVEAAPPVGIEGRVLIRDFVSSGIAADESLGETPRVRPVSDVKVVALNGRGQPITATEVTPNGNFFLRLPRGRHILNVPELGISREIVVGRSGVRGLRLNLDLV